MSRLNKDVEEAKNPKRYLEGFSEFSHFIASDESLSVYRRFGALGARNIINLQAELQFLEQQLEILDAADLELVHSQGERTEEQKLVDEAARAWESFEHQANEGDERQKVRMQLILRIREVMKEYGVSRPQNIHEFI